MQGAREVARRLGATAQSELSARRSRCCGSSPTAWATGRSRRSSRSASTPCTVTWPTSARKLRCSSRAAAVALAHRRGLLIRFEAIATTDRKMTPPVQAKRGARRAARLASMIDALTDFKQATRAMWAAGDYARFAPLVAEVGERLVQRVGVRPGDAVLDVACGTGNVAIPAARAGGRVTGVDLTPEHFPAARSRATAADVAIDWVEGDAEALPFEDDSFDVVLSSFGCMFAPRHAVAAAELARVLRPDGRLGVSAFADRGAGRRLLPHARRPPARPAAVRGEPARLGRPGPRQRPLPRARARVRARVVRRALRVARPRGRALHDDLRADRRARRRRARG